MAYSRDPKLWPYPPESIWNMPLGDAAVMVPAELTVPVDKTIGPEEDTLLLDPDLSMTDVLKHDGGWKDTTTNGTRCENILDPVQIMGSIPCPDDWSTDPDYYGDRPNMSSFALLNETDYQGWESQPFHICDGSFQPISQYHNDTLGEGPGSSLLTGGMANGDSHGGSHGGSKMTAMGGTIRLGEWVPGGVIKHALKLVISSYENIYGGGSSGYRWPSNTQDEKWPDSYGGTVPELLMGALLALPPAFDVAALQTESGRIVAQAFQHYGGYVVDSSGYSSIFQYAIERGPQGRVMDEFETVWGYPMDGRTWQASGDQLAYFQDQELIIASLMVVDDNALGNVGGAGTRMTDMAPAFDEEPPPTPGTGSWKVWDGSQWIGGTMNVYDGEGWIQ